MSLTQTIHEFIAKTITYNLKKSDHAMIVEILGEACACTNKSPYELTLDELDNLIGFILDNYEDHFIE